jgi:hypothetical protein
MIDYAKVKYGDTLRVVGECDSDFAKPGDLVRVVQANANSVLVCNERQSQCEFVSECGAAKLAPSQ